MARRLQRCLDPPSPPPQPNSTLLDMPSPPPTPPATIDKAQRAIAVGDFPSRVATSTGKVAPPSTHSGEEGLKRQPPATHVGWARKAVISVGAHANAAVIDSGTTLPGSCLVSCATSDKEDEATAEAKTAAAQAAAAKAAAAAAAAAAKAEEEAAAARAAAARRAEGMRRALGLGWGAAHRVLLFAGLPVRSLSSSLPQVATVLVFESLQ